MRNLLWIDNNGNNQLLDNACNLEDYQVRKLNDIFSLAGHVKEFNPDLVIFHLTAVTDAFLNELNGLTAQINIPVMIFTGECCSNHINKIIQAEVSYLCVNGLPITSLNSKIEIAFARFNHLQKLKTALEEARTQLEDRKQIDRAKAILIKTRSFSEDEAYHTLRKLAMGRNITLGEMARNVIAMADLLK
jgi:response regulator NasT